MMNKLKELGVCEWFRYVDDTFVILNNKNELTTILSYINKLHKSIKFTYELEKKNSIAFLDVNVKKTNNNLTTTIYRKPTFTGVMLNWNSLTSKRYKINLIGCLLTRAYGICSDLKSLHIEIEKIKQILYKNDYPSLIVDKQIKKFLDQKLNEELRRQIENKKEEQKINKLNFKTIYLCLPFVNNEVENFGKDLSKLVEDFFNNVKLKVVFKAPKEIKDLFKFKDKIRTEMKSHVVYKIKCKDCDSFYIGKTKRQLLVRIGEHQSGKGKEENISALYKHHKQTNHRINYEEFEILDQADSDRKLLLKEMLHIKRLIPDLNVQKETKLNSLII